MLSNFHLKYAQKARSSVPGRHSRKAGFQFKCFPWKLEGRKAYDLVLHSSLYNHDRRWNANRASWILVLIHRNWIPRHLK